MTQVVVTQQDSSLEIAWDAPTSLQASPSIEAVSLPLVNVQGWRLPAQLIAVEQAVGWAGADDLATLQPAEIAEIAQLNVVPWLGVLEPVAHIVPVLLHNDGSREERPALAQPTLTPTLPTAPMTLVRQGILRGRHIRVYAFSPLFQQQGQLVLATQFRAKLTGARLISGLRMMQIMQEPFAAVSAINPYNLYKPQVMNTSTLRKLIVARQGIQRLTARALSSVGLSLNAADAARVHVRFKGKDVALEWRGLEDGVFDGQDELRFYAQPPGDRWNSTAVYWLSIEPESIDASVSMAVVPSSLTTAPLRTTATERGVWRAPTFYDSTLRGPDGDHWFAQTLSAAAGVTSVATLTLPSALPLASGIVSLTVFGSTYNAGTRTLSVQMVNPATGKPTTTTDTDAPDDTHTVFEGAGDWSHRFALAGNTPALALNLASANNDQYLVDGVAYERPVMLNLGGRSAAFWSVAGVWAYQLKNVPVQATLYDVSDPLRPVIQPLSDDRFQAGPMPQAFWLSNPADEVQPVIEVLPDASSLDQLQPNLDQIYIAPRALRPALAPLIALRYSQHHTASVVAVEDIYNAFGDGVIAPDAIRAFLRNVVQQHPSLKAITLVGDGSDDPLNHSGKANPTLIPPFLADVDPWIGETACDACYAQLDGDDVTSDVLPDLQVGRLPVKTVAELTALVSKMIDYETAPSGAWNWRSIHLADNYLDAKGNPDPAGNFLVYEDTAAQQQPAGVVLHRLYYTPQVKPNPLPWHEPNPLKAHERVVALFNAGGAIANFQGHGNVDRLAFTDDTRGSPINYLLGAADVAALNNGHRLPILIEMACLTSAFQRPLDKAATIDELLVLAPNGGAIATWGATGMGLAYQHDFLQRGFYEALWVTPQMDATIGDLTQQSLLRMFTDAACCHDALRTFVLLGDPMTMARAFVPQRMHLPVVVN